MKKEITFQSKRIIGSGLALACLALCAAAYAANPAVWWNDISNDRAGDVQTLLAQGADPNEANNKGQPAIMQAIRDGAWHVYDILASDRKTAIDAVNSNNETPLMYLAIAGQTKRAEALINRGAKVNRLGWTPLQYAASKGHLDTVKMLIAHKAIVDAPAPDGTTALMMAAFSGSQPVVQALLDAGAEVTTQNLDHHDAADWAHLRKHDDLAKQLAALIKKTQDQRTIQHAKNQEREAASEASGSGTNATVPAAEVTPETGAAQPAATVPDASNGTAAGKPENNSSSRYFNPADTDPNASH